MSWRTFSKFLRQGATYENVVELLFGEKSPPDYNFLRCSSDIQEIYQSSAYDNVTVFKENPNPKAIIGFIIRYPFQYYIYESVYRHLPESEFIVDLQWMKSEMEEWHKVLKRLIGFLEKRGACFRLANNYSNKSSDNFFQKYTVLASNALVPVLKIITNRNKKKVRFMYGHSKDLYNFGPWLRHFDLSLTYGPFSNEATNVFTKGKIVGNSRFDDWFLNKIDEKSIDAFREKLNLNKKTVLYLPTHSDLSSLEFFLPSIRELLKKFNLVIKPHYITSACELERLNNFKLNIGDAASSVVWADDFDDLCVLLSVADTVISDNSGAVFDALLVDKPLVILDTLNEEFFEKEQWRPQKRSPHVWLWPATYKESTEQKIKRGDDFLIGEVVRRQNEIVQAVDRSLKNFSKYAPVREKMKNQLFSYRNGTSGKRAADFLKKLALSRNEEKEKRPLALSFKAEDALNKAAWEDYFSLWENVTGHFINTHPYWENHRGENEVIFTVVLEYKNDADATLQTLHSLISQVILQERLEVVIISGKQTIPEPITKFLREFATLKLRWLYGESSNTAKLKNAAATNARGTFLCFPEDNFIPPSDWLSSLRENFKQNPEIAAIAGIEENTAFAQKSVQILDQLDALTQKFICVRKSAFDLVGGYNIHLPSLFWQDRELKMRLKKYRFPVLYRNTPAQNLPKDQNVSLGGFLGDFFYHAISRYLVRKLYSPRVI